MEIHDSSIIVLTGQQLREFAMEAARAAICTENKEEKHNQEDGKHYVYGIRGIRELFGVSHATAQRYKNTFLAPAIMQRGRNIVVDADKARLLFMQQNPT